MTNKVAIFLSMFLVQFVIITLFDRINLVWSMSLWPFYQFDGYTGQVIDRESREGISDASVLIVYKSCYSTIAGRNCGSVDAAEAITDKDGRFKILRKKEWFGNKRGHPRGMINIFKPGYGTLWHPASRALGGDIPWPRPEKHIIYTLPKLCSIEDRWKYLPSLSLIFYKLNLRPELVCPNFLRLLNEEERFLGMQVSPHILLRQGNYKMHFNKGKDKVVPIR